MTTARWTLPVAILLGTLCWVVTFFLLPEQRWITDAKIWSAAKAFVLLLPNYIPITVSFVAHLFIVYFLIEINNAFTIIRIRSSILPAIYFLLIAFLPTTHIFSLPLLAGACFIIALYYLFKSYQQRQSDSLFYTFFFLGAGSLFFPSLTWLIPIWLIGTYQLQSLTFRGLFAALLGWSLPYWFLFGHAAFYGQMELFYQPFIELSTFAPIFQFSHLAACEYATFGLLLILYIVSTIHYINTRYKDKIRTRSYLDFLVNVTFWLFVWLIMQPQHSANLLPLLTINISILSAHFFALTDNKASNLFFILTIISSIAVFILNIWMLL